MKGCGGVSGGAARQVKAAARSVFMLLRRCPVARHVRAEASADVASSRFDARSNGGQRGCGELADEPC